MSYNQSPTVLAPPFPFLLLGRRIYSYIIRETFPSINEVLYLSPHKRAKFEREERGRWHAYAVSVFNRERRAMHHNPQGLLQAKAPVSSEPLFCSIYIRWQPKRKSRDITNPYVKGFFDGLTDAGFWPNDSLKYLRGYTVIYGGELEYDLMQIDFNLLNP